MNIQLKISFGAPFIKRNKHYLHTKGVGITAQPLTDALERRVHIVAAAAVPSFISSKPFWPCPTSRDRMALHHRSQTQYSIPVRDNHFCAPS